MKYATKSDLKKSMKKDKIEDMDMMKKENRKKKMNKPKRGKR